MQTKNGEERYLDQMELKIEIGYIPCSNFMASRVEKNGLEKA
jgi:hypothetical protein